MLRWGNWPAPSKGSTVCGSPFRDPTIARSAVRQREVLHFDPVESRARAEFLATTHSTGVAGTSGLLRGIMRAGTPTATELLGTFSTTTALAPIATSSPIVMAPRIFRTCSDIHPIPDFGRTADAGMAKSNGYSITNYYIIAKRRVATDDNIAEVLDLEAPADLSFAGQLNPGQDLAYHPFKYFVNQGQWRADDAILEAIAPTPEAVHHHHPQTGP